MPLTKTAKRALRSSKRKRVINTKMHISLEKAIRQAKKGKSEKLVVAAMSLADRAAKRKIIHKNKAARIKKSLSSLSSKSKSTKSQPTSRPKKSKKK